MRKFFHIMALLFVCTLYSWAQSISISAPQEVNTGEQFRVKYTIQTQDVKGFRGGEFPEGLQVLMGPSMSSQSSFQMINGHASSSSSITYTYIVYAEKPGSYTIPAATAEVGGKRVSSPHAKVKVSGQPQSSSSSSQNTGNHSSRNIKQAGSPISSSELFIKVSANKTKVHEQEPIVLTYKLYTQVEVTQLEGKMPDLKGFHTQEVELPKQKSFHVETINGRPYRCVTSNKYVMYPQMTGKLEIPSITFKGTVVQENRNVDPFEAFFNGGSGYIEVRKDIVAPALTINVLPLPTRPAGFSGGVGKFSISASIDKEDIPANEAATLRVVVSGVGNMKLIRQPVINFPKDFDKYDPKTTDKTKLTDNGLEGNMIYDFLFVPRNQGTHTIPPIEFTYYDISSNAYKTVKTQPLTINVTPGKATTTTVSDFTEKDADIHGIKLSDSKTLEKDIFFATTLYNTIIAAIIIIFVVLIVVFRKRAIANADIVGKRGKKANKVATKRLKKAARLMKEEKYDEFYDEVLRALWGYVSDKMNIAVSELSRENITERLLSHNVNQEIIDTFVTAIDECEYARYAPGEVHGKMNNVYEKAMKGITNIDDFLKGKNNNKKTSGGHREPQYNCIGKTFSLFLTLIAFLMVSPAYCNTKQAADEAYSKGNYQLAIRTYEQLLQKTPSAEIYYNLGNAYFRSDNIPQAIIAYEKAAKLSPADPDIRHNLSVARTKTIDKMQPRQETFIIAGWQTFVNLFNTNTWATIAIVSLILVILCVLTYLFVETVLLRQIGFYGGILCILIFIVSNVCAYSQYSDLKDNRTAVIVKSVCNVKRSPELKAVDETIVHEGTRLTIVDETVSGWYEVVLDDGTEGWITTDGIERITLSNKK